MDAVTYRRFTEELVAWATEHLDVLGLVALGSMADVTHSPDEWSDHDFWVVASDAAAPAIRDDRSWLPDAERIVLFFAETKHGRNVVYDDGHLIEQAVFGDTELEDARANAYRVLVDKGTISDRMRAIADRTAAATSQRSPDVMFGKFLAQLVIGLSRHGRGELVSAGWMVRSWAEENFMGLVRDHATPQPSAPIDNLDAHRRAEVSFPTIAARLDGALRRPVPDAALAMLDLAEELFAAGHSWYDPAAVAAVRSLAVRARTAQPSARLHHVQLAMPPDGEAPVREFYGDVLGMIEIEKPPELAARGGCWFRLHDLEIHLGVEDPFRPARKAHPGIAVDNLDDLAVRLAASGHDVTWDPHFPGYRRLYTNDPHGNRIELMGRDVSLD